MTSSTPPLASAFDRTRVRPSGCSSAIPAECSSHNRYDVHASTSHALRLARANPPLACSNASADKPRMARAVHDHDDLRRLVERLLRSFAKHHDSWATQIEPASLRAFRRRLDESSELFRERAAEAQPTKSPSAREEKTSPTDARLDRVRTICAECLVAERLLLAGCEVEYEVETPSGRHVDFRAWRDGAALDIHVKRAPQPTLRDTPAVVPNAWRTLETVHRNLVVALALTRNLRGRALHAALDEAFAFVEQASVGDEIAFRDAEARTAARLRAIAPSTSGHVELVPDHSASFDSHVPRFQATLRKAFAQFMPRSENVIVVCGSTGGFEAFATALLGSHIERWDKKPRVGELMAYGRGGDGFWSGAMRNQSRIAIYWALERNAQPLVFLREPSVATERAKAAVALARKIFA